MPEEQPNTQKDSDIGEITKPEVKPNDSSIPFSDATHPEQTQLPTTLPPDKIITPKNDDE